MREKAGTHHFKGKNFKGTLRTISRIAKIVGLDFQWRLTRLLIGANQFQKRWKF